MKTLDLNEAADFLGVHRETARRLAATGKMPGAKVGKAWRFIQEDLALFMRSLYPHQQASQGVITNRSTEIWHYLNAEMSGGSASATMDTEYNEALGTSDRIAAQRLHDKLKAEIWTIAELNERPCFTWKDAVKRWLKESQHKRSLKDDILNLRWLDQYLRHASLHEISADKIENIAIAKESEGVKPATVNRMLEVVRAILRKACKEWEWIDKIPAIRMRHVENKRIRWLTPKEANRLIKRIATTSVRHGGILVVYWFKS